MIISYDDLKTASAFATTNETLANDADKAHNRIMFYVSGTRKNASSWNVSISANRAKTPDKTTFAQTVTLSDLNLVSKLNQIAKLSGKLILDIRHSDSETKQITIDGKKN